MLTNTASIGNAVLKSALYLRDNYRVMESNQTLDLRKSGCYSCEVYYQDGFDDSFCGNCPDCNECPHKVYTTSNRKIYVNEKNRFKERHLLKKNAILLFMYLHFLNPDANGLVYVDIEDAADTLSCSERTIKNNLALLNRHNYIDLAPNAVAPGYYRLFLSEYKTYFLPAHMGGRGYSIIAKSTFKELSLLPDINSLRLAIRNILPETEPKAATDRRLARSYKEIKRDLPTYCSKNTIRKISSTSQFQKLFRINAKKRFIIIEAKEEHNPLHTANALRSDCRIRVTKLISSINASVASTKNRILFNVTETQLNDIANIALKIPVQYITSAIRLIYDEYISHNQHVQNLPALVRTVADEHYNSLLAM